jgi:predicted NBD/HSP70 family sugar kinase
MTRSRRSHATAPGSLEALREGNRNRIVTTLRAVGAVSRAELARRTGLSRSTVSIVVSELVREGLVREAGEAQTAGTGRPATPLFLDPAAGSVLAVDLAPGRLTLALFDLGHREIGQLERELDPDRLGLDGIVVTIRELFGKLLRGTRTPRASVIGAAMAIPAPIETATRRIGQESGIAAIVGASFERAAEEALKLPVHVENDANLSALAELYWGAAVGHRDAVFVELSSGVGAGLIIDGRLHRGARGTAGEIGHMPVASDGAICRCGNRGCLELVAGTGAITTLVADRFAATPIIGEVIAQAESGDPMCRRALRDVGARIGYVLGGLCNVLNPTAIVIGGDLAGAWSVMQPAMREAIDRSAIQPAIVDLHIAPSQLGPRGRLLGGLALVLHDSVRFPLVRPASSPPARSARR